MLWCGELLAFLEGLGGGHLSSAAGLSFLPEAPIVPTQRNTGLLGFFQN